MRRVPFVFFACLCLAGCADAPTPVTSSMGGGAGGSGQTTPCQSGGDCAIGERCQDGVCVQSGGCVADSECPEGRRCIEGGCYLEAAPDAGTTEGLDVGVPDVIEEDTGQTVEACTGCVQVENGVEVCLRGRSDLACGSGGEACVACERGEGCSDQGICERIPTCDSSNCAGCCQGDMCLAGTEETSCGRGGLQCQRCPQGALCSAEGACEEPCGPLNCQGCCDFNGVCVPSEDAFCGRAGAACTSCGGEQRCEEGTCVDLSCSETCDGCCSGGTCLSGTSSTDCGFPGSACVDCGPGRLCESNTCVLDPRSRWDLVIISADLSENSPSGEAWDAFGGLPDPYVEVSATDGFEVFEGATEYIGDQLNPFWYAVVLNNVPAEALLNNVQFLIKDSDPFPFEDALMAGVSTSLSDALFTGETLIVNCPASEGVLTAATLRFLVVRH